MRFQKTRKTAIAWLLVVVCLLAAEASAQLASNPKLAAADLEAAKAEALQSGGANAELIYAARLDVVQKGAFDCLIVIYAKPARTGKDYYAVVLREARKYPIAFDKQGRVLKSGDKYLRMGLKHEEGKSPILRLIASTTDPVKGEQQRNLDFRFNGDSFTLENQSVAPIPR